MFEISERKISIKNGLRVICYAPHSSRLCLATFPPRGRLDIRLKFFTLYFLYFYSLFSLFFIRKGVETLDDVNLFRIVRVEVFTI